MIKKTIQKILFFYLVIITNASALIEIDITEGNREPLPIAITNFFYSEDAIKDLSVYGIIAQIVRNGKWGI